MKGAGGKASLLGRSQCREEKREQSHSANESCF